jgi:trk system potassium uptake protein TrkA
MRVAIVGAGAVGRSIAQALLSDGHKVLLIERRRTSYRPQLVPEADWMLADACEMATLSAAGISGCDVVLAASGDDKVNLVFAMLAKVESGVPRVVARVNDPDNEELFTAAWGVDVAVSTPRALVAGVEGAVTVGDIVRLMTLNRGRVDILEITLPADSVHAGATVSELNLPDGSMLLAVLRRGTMLTRQGSDQVLAGDAMLIAAPVSLQPLVRAALRETVG